MQRKEYLRISIYYQKKFERKFTVFFQNEELGGSYEYLREEEYRYDGTFLRAS